MSKIVNQIREKAKEQHIQLISMEYEQLAQAYLWNVFLLPASHPLEEEWIFHGLFTIRSGMFKNCQIPFRIHIPLLLYPPLNNFQLPFYFTSSPCIPHPFVYETTGFFNLTPYIQHLFSKPNRSPPNLLLYCLHFVKTILESESVEELEKNCLPFCEIWNSNQWEDWKKDSKCYMDEIHFWKTQRMKQISLETVFRNEWFHPSLDDFQKTKHWDTTTLQKFLQKLQLD